MPHRCLTWMFLLPLMGMISSCASVSSMTTWNETHAGVKYSFHKDHRSHRIEKGQNGRVMYDSPELTVVSEHGQLKVNGQHAGPVQQGDTVEITNMGTVLVNGQRRGDTTTGQAENRYRLQQRMAHTQPPSQIQQAGHSEQSSYAQ